MRTLKYKLWNKNSEIRTLTLTEPTKHFDILSWEKRINYLYNFWCLKHILRRLILPLQNSKQPIVTGFDLLHWNKIWHKLWPLTLTCETHFQAGIAVTMSRKGKRSQTSKVRWQKFVKSQPSTPAEQAVSSDPYINRQVHFPESSHANVTCVLASRSQGSRKRADSKNSQCTCNSATFLAFLLELHHLHKAELDVVLDRGHAMYSLTLDQLSADGRKVHRYLNTEEIPETVLGYR